MYLLKENSLQVQLLQILQQLPLMGKHTKLITKMTFVRRYKLIRLPLLIVGLGMIATMSPGCCRIVNSIPISGAGSGKPFVSIYNPYFYGSREIITELGSLENPGWIPFLILDLPFEFAVDALVELPWKGLHDLCKPLSEMSEN